MFSLVNTDTAQVVLKRDTTSLVFDGVPGKMRILLPTTPKSEIHAASAGDSAGAFKVYTVTEVDAGSGPVVVSTSDPVFDAAADTVTVTRTLEAESAASIKERTNHPILRQIAVLELSTLRSLREMRRGEEFGDIAISDIAFAKKKIKDLDEQIQVLRATLV